MKSFIMGLTLITSLSTYAGVNSCQVLLGKYTCIYQGQELPLTITGKASTNTIEVNIDGEGDEYIVDGQSHNSKNDDSQNVAICKDGKELIADNYFRGELKGSIALAKTSVGVAYTMVQGSSSIEISCAKNK